MKTESLSKFKDVRNRNEKSTKRGVGAALYVTRVAVMAGMLTALKFALSFIPNVEVVTLLILVYSAAFGVVYALPAVIVFCLVEVLIYGLGSWVPLYFVYWPLLAVLGSLLLKNGNVYVAVTVAVLGSLFFGVLSACSDTVFVLGYVPVSQAGKYWVAYYVRGLYFDAIHAVGAAVSTAVLFLPLFKVSKRLSRRDFVVCEGEKL